MPSTHLVFNKIITSFGTQKKRPFFKGILNWFVLSALLLTIINFSAACSVRKPLAQPFDQPIDSRLILQVPFFDEKENGFGPAALASVMNYNGRQISLEQAAANISKNVKSMGRDMVIYARREGLKANFYGGSPEQLVKAVQDNKPLVVYLERDAAPLIKDHYVVVVGYTPDGPVVNSSTVNQQIVPWSTFLTAWLGNRYYSVMIEPL